MKKLLLALTVATATLMLKAQNPYPTIPLDTVQFVNAQKLANAIANTLPDYINPVFRDTLYRDTVRFTGIVATNPKIYGLSANRKAAYIQRKGGGPWSGVLVMCEPSGTGTTLANLLTETKFYDNFVVGFPVKVTGVFRDFQGETQINLIRNNALWTNEVEQVSLVKDTLVYTNITADQLMKGNPNTGWIQQKSTAEQWEGVLVQIPNVTVYSTQISGNRTFWSVIDDAGNVIDIRDMSAYYRRDDNEDTVPKVANTFQAPPIGTRLEFIRGIVTEYAASGVQRYGIAPIYLGDVKVCTSCPPIVKFIRKTPTVLRANDTLDIVYEVTVGDTTLRSNRLFYKRGNGPMDSVTLTAVSGFPNTYRGRINPPHVADEVISYWVKAEDRKDRTTIFPDPFTDGSKLYVTADGIRSISTLQFSPFTNLATIWNGDSIFNDVVTRISVPAVVTSTTLGFGNITLQSGTGPNSAIYVVRTANDSASKWEVGDSVEITAATVRESSNVTSLFSVRGNILAKGVTLPPFAMNLPIDSFELNRIAYARPYEGVLLKWDSATVANKNPDAPNNFGEFTITRSKSSASVLRIDDLNSQLAGLNNKLKAGMQMSFIQGPMYFRNGQFKLAPRGLSDVDLSKLDTVEPVITLLGDNPDTTYKGLSYVDAGATATDNLDGDITSKIVKIGSVDTSKVGTYIISYVVADNWGFTDSVSRTVVVLDTSTVGINENELNFARISLYPVPAKEQLTISAGFIQSVPVQMTIVDLLGKQYMSRTFTQKQFTEQIEISQLNSGIYFCVLKNNGGVRTIKFMVSR
jgi:hypothetical protein